MERLVCLLLGYALGLFQTGYIYGKMHHMDIRKYGSGNSGTTNALRVMGKKAGMIVFAGDFLKTVLAFVLIRLIFKGQTDSIDLLALYGGAGVVLGHNFPFYLKFKGGKGIASMAGIMFSLDWRITLACIVIFVAAVGITRYVSLGSILVSVTFLAGILCFGSQGSYQVAQANRIEFYCLAGLLTGMAVWRHRANIKRLLGGTENKLWGGKK